MFVDKHNFIDKSFNNEIYIYLFISVPQKN